MPSCQVCPNWTPRRAANHLPVRMASQQADDVSTATINDNKAQKTRRKQLCRKQRVVVTCCRRLHRFARPGSACSRGVVVDWSHIESVMKEHLSTPVSPPTPACSTGEQRVVSFVACESLSATKRNQQCRRRLHSRKTRRNGAIAVTR
jgi:hypothetical protein